jgi:hypothetical protein
MLDPILDSCEYEENIHETSWNVSVIRAILVSPMFDIPTKQWTLQHLHISHAMKKQNSFDMSKKGPKVISGQSTWFFLFKNI